MCTKKTTLIHIPRTTFNPHSGRVVVVVVEAASKRGKGKKKLILDTWWRGLWRELWRQGNEFKQLMSRPSSSVTPQETPHNIINLPCPSVTHTHFQTWGEGGWPKYYYVYPSHPYFREGDYSFLWRPGAFVYIVIPSSFSSATVSYQFTFPHLNH